MSMERRMPRVEVALDVRVHGALSVGGLGGAAPLADRHVVRDAWGRLLLPGSHLKGRMRHACEQVARTLGLPVCRAPHAAAMCPRDPSVPTPPCPVCALFGSPAWPSPLRWADLPCADEQSTDGGAGTPLPAALRAGIALNRRRGTVEAGRLFFLETSPPLPAGGLRFAHERAIAGQLADAAPLQLLLAGCRLLTSFGGGETRGLGWSAVAAEARLDDAPVAFAPGQLAAGRP
jgi:CRISPR/Cas system CSM-associated protein Csm3 (group 7 of RAMP superfamily)